MGLFGGPKNALLRRRTELLKDYRALLDFSEQCLRLFDLMISESSGAATERSLVEFSGVELVESRKGARITERSSYSSGRSYSGVRVGPIYVGGSSGAARASTTISHAAPDELTLIDSGGVLVTTRAISFVGSQFTRTTEFRKVVDSERRGRQILIAPSNASKVYILGFESEVESFLVFVLLWSATQEPSRTLDQSRQGVLEHGLIGAATARAEQVLADELVEKRNAIRDLVVAIAQIEGCAAAPLPIPAPRPSLCKRMEKDALVPFDAVPVGALTSRESPRLLSIAILLSLFGGLSGLDRFYLGYWREGFIKLCTAGGMGVLWLRDLGLLMNEDLPDAQGRPLSGAPIAPIGPFDPGRSRRYADGSPSASEGTNSSR